MKFKISWKSAIQSQGCSCLWLLRRRDMCQRHYMSNVLVPIKPFLAIREYSLLTYTKSLSGDPGSKCQKMLPFTFLSLTLDQSVFLSSPEKRESQLSRGGGAVRRMMGKHTHSENDGLPPLSPYTPCSEHLEQVIIILAWFTESSLLLLAWKQAESLWHPVQGHI